MNCRLYSLLFALAVIGFASAQTDVPSGTANMTGNSDQVRMGEPYQAQCDYTIHKPQSTSDSDWELTVAFHNEVMSMSGGDRFPVVAEFRQNGTNMVFHTVRLLDGMNVWPADGVNSRTQSPMKVVMIPNSSDSMSMVSSSQWKCSVTMKRKGTDAKVRFNSKTYMATPGPN